MKEELKREDIPVEYTWDIKSMFKDYDEWNKMHDKVEKLANEFEEYKDTLTNSSNEKPYEFIFICEYEFRY